MIKLLCSSSKPERAVDGINSLGDTGRYWPVYDWAPYLVVDLGSLRQLNIIKIIPRLDQTSGFFKRSEVWTVIYGFHAN